MLEIYTPMAGDLAEEALNSLALLIGSGTFHSAINIAMIAGVGGTAYAFITGKKIENLMRFIFVSFTLLFILIGIKFPVAIIDMQQPYVSHEVDDIPLGVALPSAFVSQIGRAIAQSFEDVFHMPDDLSYNESGMLFGSRIALATRSANFGIDPNLSQDLSNYMRQCIFISKIQVTQKLTVNELVNSPDLTNELFEDASPVYRVILHDLGNVSCIDAAAHLKTELNAAAESEAQRYANKFTDGDKGKFEASLGNAQNYFLGVSQTGTALLKQNMLINMVNNAVQDAMAFSGNTAAMMNYSNTVAMNHLRMTEANNFAMAGYRLPMLNACLWILMMCLFPIVILLAFFPLFEKSYMFFIGTMIWLWSWQPMFSILNFFVSYYASIQTNIFGEQSGGITMSNADPIAMVHSDMAFTAGSLAFAIPFIAKGLTSGMATAFSQASQLLGSITQSSSNVGVSGLEHGNMSVGQFSAYNQNYDNFNAHKHDTNSTNMHGLKTEQLANGSTLTTTPDGHQIVSSAGSMSHLAVSLQGSQAVSNSFTQSAQTAHNRGDTYRHSADESYQSAIREANNFSQSDANDFRAGGGKSVTDTYGITQDLRHMQDAVHDWNRSHDGTKQIDFKQAVSANASVGMKFLGNGGGIGASVSSNHSHAQSENLKEFFSSKQGQSFSESYNHALNSASNIHMDGSRSHQLSHAEQFAVDMNKAHNYSEQAAHEYSESQNYAKAASLAVSDSQNINTNMTNDFVTWAQANKGEEANSVLSATEGEHLTTQQQWSREYMASEQGQSALASERQQYMQAIASGTSLTQFNADNNSGANQAAIHKQYQQDMNGLKPRMPEIDMMSKKDIEDAQKAMRQAHHQNLMKQAKMTQAVVHENSEALHHQIDQSEHNNQNKVNDELEHGVVMGDLKSASSTLGKQAAKDLDGWLNNRLL